MERVLYFEVKNMVLRFYWLYDFVFRVFFFYRYVRFELEISVIWLFVCWLFFFYDVSFRRLGVVLIIGLFLGFGIVFGT